MSHVVTTNVHCVVVSPKVVFMKRCPELTDVTRHESYGARSILKLAIKLVAFQVFERALWTYNANLRDCVVRNIVFGVTLSLLNLNAVDKSYSHNTVSAKKAKTTIPSKSNNGHMLLSSMQNIRPKISQFKMNDVNSSSCLRRERRIIFPGKSRPDIWYICNVSDSRKTTSYPVSVYHLCMNLPENSFQIILRADS